MSDISKITIAVDGDNIAFGVPFTKIDVKNRTVEGFATLDNIDKANEVVDFEASKEAFSSWIGNIREMHSPKAVGKAISIEEKKLEKDGQTYSGIWVKSRISKGAADTWEKVLDGTLAGYSIGGKVLERKPEVMKSDSDSRYSKQMVNRITKYHLGELSVVDNPMNALALFEDISKAEALIKSEDGQLMLADALIEDKGLFYCETCDVAKTDDVDAKTVDCITCDGMMSKIGQVTETPGITDLKKMVDAHFGKDSGGTDDETEKGFGVPVEAFPAPEIVDTTPQLITQTTWTEVPTPEAETPYQGAQKTEVTVRLVLDEEDLKSRVESLWGDKNNYTSQKSEDAEFIEAILTPDNYKSSNPNAFPVDSMANIRASRIYFNYPGQRNIGGYSMSDWAEIGRRVGKAAEGKEFDSKDIKHGELLINLQKNNNDVNTNVVDLLKGLVDGLSKGSNSPTIQGGDTPTLDVTEFSQKILDVLDVASNEIREMSKALNAQSLNSENGAGPTLGASDPGEAGIGTSQDNDGSAPMPTTDVTVADATSLATPDAGPEKVVPNKIDTTADSDPTPGQITADSGPEKVLPHADLSSTSVTTKAEEAEAVAEEETEKEGDLVKAALEDFANKFTEKFDVMTSRLETIEKSGGTKKSAEVTDDNLTKSDTSIWSGSFYSGEFDK